MDHPTATDPLPADDPLCAFCGGEVPLMGAIVYHGVVYHPMCVEPTTRPARDIRSPSREDAARRDALPPDTR